MKEGRRAGDRREFLGKAARFSVLVLLGSLVGRLALRGRIAAPGRSSCTADGICARCRRNGDCVQPQAQSYRAVRGGRNP